MKKNLSLILIILLAFILRFYRLGLTPPGLYWDEVSLGYNAYSILKTGRDEHNDFLPYARFKAFGDYKPPGYIYATVPSIAVFGLNNFSVRFPSALAGTLTVLVTYLLVHELFATRHRLALLSSGLLAISPWHLQLSRVAFESNLAALFNVLAIYLFLKSRRQPWLIILSALSFFASLNTFNANRLLSILLVALLSLLYFQHLIKNLKFTLIAGFTGILLVLPLVPHLRSAEGKLRWHEVNIFSNLDVIINSNQQITLDNNTRLAKLIHHRYLGHLTNFLKHYFDHFDGRYLFTKGDNNPRFSVQEVGELYLIELPFLLLGLYTLIKQSDKRSTCLLIGWFLLAPIPAAMARETPHALRTLSILPVPQILISLGLSRVRPKRLVAAVVCSLYAVSFLYFQIIYYHYFPQEYAGEWLTSYPRLVNFLKTTPANRYYITPDLGRPYIYFLFYNRYPPQQFVQTANITRDVFGVYTVNRFDKYSFGHFQPGELQSGDIFVVRATENFPGFESLAIISDINGDQQFNVLRKL